MNGYSPADDFVRYVKAYALHANEPEKAAPYAAQLYGRASMPAILCRAAVPGVGTADLIGDPGLAASAQAAFIDAADRGTILDKLKGLLRIVAPNQPFYPAAESTIAHFTGENKPIRCSRMAFSPDSLPTRKVGSMAVVSKAVLSSTTPEADNLFGRDMKREVGLARDRKLIDPSNAGDSVTPASITNGAPSISSSGNVKIDLAEAIELFEGDFGTAAWVMHPRLAPAIGAAMGSGASTDLGLNGGILLGLRAICSAAVPMTSSGASPLMLVDAGGIAAFDEGLDLAVAESGAVELDDAPTGATDTPVGMSATIVSLFQTDCVAIRLTRRCNWKNGRPGGVVVVTGCTYGA